MSVSNKKNIIISGCPRSGKTALSTLIKREWPYYNILHCDTVRNTIVSLMDKSGFDKCFHDDNMMTDLMIEFINQSIMESEYPYIVEWSRLFPSLTNRIAGEVITVSLSLGHILSDELVKMCRRYDDDTDFTYHMSDPELKEHCDRWISVNDRILLEKDCSDIFVNTYDNRNQAFEYVIDKLRNAII